MTNDANGSNPGRLELVELLHVDTVNSGTFYTQAGVNDAEKSACQKLLRDLFDKCCQKHGGRLALWAGDGGHAIFIAQDKAGAAIAAATDFTKELPALTAQTATTLGLNRSDKSLVRHFRIKAHYCQLFLAPDSGLNSGATPEFDDFLKNEKLFAPLPDELFITKQLWKQLSVPEKNFFEKYKSPLVAGSLQTEIFRRKAVSKTDGRSILQFTDAPNNISASEWQYLRTKISSNRFNLASRNFITSGLLKTVSAPDNKGQFKPDDLATLTIRALYNYLRAFYEYEFRVSVWIKEQDGDGKFLKKQYGYYPKSEEWTDRRVPITDFRYKVVQAFTSLSPIVTGSVNSARIAQDWIDFDSHQIDPNRALNSALQLPIYMVVNKDKTVTHKDPLGVLSLDSDKPDMFMPEDIDLWREDLIGYLANLALAIQMQTMQDRASHHG